MNYCKNCGTKLDEQDSFCARCGSGTVDTGENRGYVPLENQADVRLPENEPLDKLFCELAYSGILFWLPLLAYPKKELARYSANQGLWVLILSTAACWGIQILGAIKDVFAGWIFGTVLRYLCITVYGIPVLYVFLSFLRLQIRYGNSSEQKAGINFVF